MVLLAPAAQAARPALPQGLTVAVEPIFGFEHIQKLSPTVHFKNRLTYGARFTAGYLVLSGEGEYTRASDAESYPLEDLSLKDTDDTFKLGVRTGYALSQLFIASLRVGGQARRSSHEQTTAGVTTVSDRAIEVHPYAGTELRVALSDRLALSAGVLVVFNDIRDMTKNEYQTTAGFQIRIK